MEDALVRERQRILADLHDGLGAFLLNLLRHVQSGRANPASIERHVRNALREMRIAIEVLLPCHGEIDTVLGSLRYQLNETIRISGVNLEWQVEKLPPGMYLDPSDAFSIQRIVIEAVTNALRDSGCRQITIAAGVVEKERIEIRIEDDGRGFNPLQQAIGLELDNIGLRAASVGVQLDISSRLGSGTTLRLLLPRSRLVCEIGTPSATPTPMP